jgi:hypothetical protein
MKKSQLRQIIKEEIANEKVIKYLKEYRDLLEEDADSDDDIRKIDELNFIITNMNKSI